MEEMTLKKLFLALLALLVMIPCAALAEMSEDISDECLLNGREFKRRIPDDLRDDSYNSFYRGSYLNIDAPEGKVIAGVQLKWHDTDMPGVELWKRDAQGEWVKMQEDGPKYSVQYIPLAEEVSSLRLTAKKGKMELSEIAVMTPGELPDWVQRWKDPPAKVDLMLFETHPDDEVLWFGGLLPYYAREREMDVLVVNAVTAGFLRRLELLDSLWTCGVEIYPVMLGYPNQSRSVSKVKQVWAQKHRDPENTTLTLIRRYKPEVVVLHDVKGEYGHSAHIVFSELGRQAVERAIDPQEHPESAEKWGVWDVPKTYIHLYAENQIHMDWQKPLASFGGKTGIEVATEAFEFHISQRNLGWTMARSEEYDNTLFGLWRTTVGPDVEKNDMFENIPAK